LTIKRNKDGTIDSITVKQEKLEKALAYSGWLVIISNCIDNAEGALSIYRSEDVVEKAFHRLKAQLDMSRLRIHKDTTMRSKVFIAFLALIIFAYLNKVMLEKKLYDQFTLREVIEILENLHLIKIKNNIILEPLTSEQKLIFNSFNIDKPNIIEIFVDN
jgi:transposase